VKPIESPTRITPLCTAILTVLGIACATSSSAEDLYVATDTLVDWPRDPVYVFYPRASCRGEEIELQIFGRREKEWIPHPAHARVPVESCQLEDAGVLWNELRWRCVEEPREGELPPAWVKGLNVFDSEVMERCSVSRDGDGFGAMQIQVTSPSPDTPLRAATPIVDIEGSVRLGGVGGADYDIVVGIDISGGSGAARRISSQVGAALRFIERVRPRLGYTRVGIITYPNVRPRRDEHTGARTEVHLTDDINRLESALRAIERRGPAGSPNFPSGLAFALDQLQHSTADGLPARLSARKLLLITADGTDPLPFGRDEDQPSKERAQVVALAQRAQESGVAIHLYALGGIAVDASPLVEEMLHNNRGSFTQVKRPRETLDYLNNVRMPYVAYVEVKNETTGFVAEALHYSSGGQFRAEVPAAFGWNHLRIDARSSEDERTHLIHPFEFDGTLVQERLRAAEKERLERWKHRREVVIDRNEQEG